MNRIGLIAAVLLVLVAASVTILLPSSVKKPTAKMGEVLLPLADQDKIAVVELRGKQPEDSLKLIRQESGVWIMDKDNFPAAPQRLATLFRELGEAKIRSAMPETKDDNQEYGFNAPTKVTLYGAREDQAQKPLVGIEIGSTRSGGGVYARLADDPQVYLLTRAITVSTDPQQWENKTLAQLPESEVKHVVVKNSRGETLVEFGRDAKGKEFNMGDTDTSDLNQYELKNTAGIGANLAFTRRVSNEDPEALKALVRPYTVSLETFSDAKIVIYIGESGTKDSKKAFVKLEVEGKPPGVNPDLLRKIQGEWLFEAPLYLVEKVKKSHSDYQAKKS